MVSRLLLIYALVELAALLGLAAVIGVGWTLLLLAATFVLGLLFGAPLGGRQLARQLAQLRSGLKDPGAAVGDGAIVTLATGLVLVPGLVTTVLGLLLLVPFVRNAARPGLAALAARSFRWQLTPFFDVRAGVRTDARAQVRRDYIDGEVIDVWEAGDPRDPVVNPRILPPRA